MKIILGLGNPGPEYENTRHNIGYWVVDALAQQHRLAFSRQKALVVFAEGTICHEKVILAKPLTFMNESGKAAKFLLRQLNDQFDCGDCMVVHDEIDLPWGKIKLKKGGGNAGHRGLESLTREIGNGYFRCRVGVGRPQGLKAAAEHVLAPMKPQEIKQAQHVSEQVRQALEDFLVQPFTQVQNRWHRQDLLDPST